MIPIVTAPQSVLSTKAKKIKKIDKEITSLISEMIVTLEHTTDPEGVGLAAPQIGRSLALFIIKESPDSDIFVFINPKVTLIPDKKEKTPREKHKTKTKKSKNVKLEGCLSLPTIWGPVHRNKKVLVLYLDEKGTFHEKTFSGFFATIVQHEYDHLNGILFPKRVLEQKGKLYKSRKNEKGEEEFDEIALP